MAHPYILNPVQTLNPAQDPQVPDWQNLELPDAWPDLMDFSKPFNVWRLIRRALKKNRGTVEIPESMPGKQIIPKYVLLEFHNLPNGNYSKCITRGYIKSFERVMLGAMDRARGKVARQMHGLQSVLDVGCTGGRMANAVNQVGVPDVWGLDPSPYLLQHAAQAFPQVKFVQGVAEETGFADQRFEGVTVCFLFHEIPPQSLDASLQEFNRILKPGGLLAISEPSPRQMRGSWISRLWHEGLAGLYYGALARLVYEPFVEAWHKQDMRKKLAEFGFELLEDSDEMPIRRLLARKVVV